MKYNNDYIQTFDFEVNLKKSYFYEKIILYIEQNLEENFAFYIITYDELILLDKDFDNSDNEFILNDLFYAEDESSQASITKVL